MDLILWRHAEAEDIRDGLADHERKLTEKGKRQAQKMAAWLAPRLPRDARIIASPAVRTVQTAKALTRKVETSELLFTSASLSDHLAVARWPDSDSTILLVGHQPTLGQLAALLMCGHAYGWEVKKGSVWWLRAAPPGSRMHATLLAALVPALLD